MKFAFWTLCACIFFACAPAGDETTEAPVAITGTVEEMDDMPVSLAYVTKLGDDKEVAADTVNAGAFSLEFAISEPALYRLNMGRNRIMVYLHPGDALTMTASGSDFGGTLLFDGAGAKPNNYLAEKVRKEKAYNKGQEEPNIYKLDLDDFLARNNEIKDINTELYNQRFGQETPSDAFATFATTEIIADWAMRMANYPDYHEYYAGVEDFEVPESYYDYKSEITTSNPAALTSPKYRGYIYAFGARKMNDLVVNDTTLSEDWPKAYRLLYEMVSASDELGPDAKDYLLANNVNDYISFFGVDGVDPIMNDYRSVNKDSELLIAIEDNYEKWAELAKGKKAPTFEYESIEGAMVSLEDYKGKVVYVDVWATWCGPCKGEIPSSKELKKSYADNDDVVFMYVSVDDNREAWEKFLENDPQFNGVHVITGTGWKSDITDSYMIQGIPRYLLIDKNGLIATASAPRPSSGDKIKNMIDDLLTSAQPSGD